MYSVIVPGNMLYMVSAGVGEARCLIGIAQISIDNNYTRNVQYTVCHIKVKYALYVVYK